MNQDSVITLTDLALKAVELADQSPDHIITTPYRYLGTDGRPSCIFGMAWLDLGGSMETLERAENLTAPNILATTFFPVTDEDEDIIDALKNAVVLSQKAQDTRVPWGEAVWPIRLWLEAVTT